MHVCIHTYAHKHTNEYKKTENLSVAGGLYQCPDCAIILKFCKMLWWKKLGKQLHVNHRLSQKSFFFDFLFYYYFFIYFFPLYSKGIKLSLHVYIFPPTLCSVLKNLNFKKSVTLPCPRGKKSHFSLLIAREESSKILWQLKRARPIVSKMK